MEFDFIFIGETHGFIQDFNKEKETIEIVKPDLVLSEQMQDMKLDSKKKMESLLEQDYFSDIVELKEVKDLIKLCMKHNIKLIGMDFKNFGFGKRLQNIIKSKINATKKDILNFEKIAKKREMLHLKMIKAAKKETKKPILILLGTWHLREDSLLMKELKNYIVIYPCIKKGEILMKPLKNKEDIRYCYKIKK